MTDRSIQGRRLPPLQQFELMLPDSPDTREAIARGAEKAGLEWDRNDDDSCAFSDMANESLDCTWDENGTLHGRNEWCAQAWVEEEIGKLYTREVAGIRVCWQHEPEPEKAAMEIGYFGLSGDLLLEFEPRDSDERSGRLVVTMRLATEQDYEAFHDAVEAWLEAQRARREAVEFGNMGLREDAYWTGRRSREQAGRETGVIRGREPPGLEHFNLELPDSPDTRDAVRDTATKLGLEWNSDWSVVTQAWLAGGDVHEALDHYMSDINGPSWHVHAWLVGDDEHHEDDDSLKISVSWERDDESEWAAEEERYGPYSQLPFRPSQSMPTGRLIVNASLPSRDDWDLFTDTLDDILGHSESEP